MLLAGKVEETPRDLKDIIVFSNEIMHTKDQREEAYDQQKELVLSGEELVLSTLNFDLIVHHPYKPLTDAIEKYKVKMAQAQFPEVALRIVNNCLQTSLCMQYKPHHVAAYAFFHAAKHLGINLQAHRGVLYKEFDITFSELEDLHCQMLELDDWYFSREEIENNSPSRLDGIDLKTESQLRKLYCKFLIYLGDRLKVNHTAIATAIVLCHRFFIRQSHAKNDCLTIAAACMLLAAKSEDTQRDIKDVILLSYEIIHEEKFDADQRKEEYEQQRKLLLSGEDLVLSTLNFDLTVHHPYETLLDAIEKYKIHEAKAEFPELAMKNVNDCVQKALSMQYKPHQIAGYGFFIAGETLNMDLKAYGMKGLLQEFDITADQMDDMEARMDELSKIDSDESVTQNADDDPVQDTSKPEGI